MLSYAQGHNCSLLTILDTYHVPSCGAQFLLLDAKLLSGMYASVLFLVSGFPQCGSALSYLLLTEYFIWRIRKFILNQKGRNRKTTIDGEASADVELILLPINLSTCQANSILVIRPFFVRKYTEAKKVFTLDLVYPTISSPYAISVKALAKP